jgi:two-component sensor histidine kinase
MPLQLIRTLFDEPAETAADGISVEDLVREANHRIANNLTVIGGLVRLQAADVSRQGKALSAEEVCTLLKEVGGRIETVSRLHRLLAQATSQSKPDLGSYLGEVASAVIGSLAGSAQFKLRTELNCPALPPSQALSLGFIVGELVTNCVKYAHPSGVAGEIRLTCRQASSGGAVVEVSDDGIGLPEGFDPSRDGGLGLRLIRSLASQLGAEVSFAEPGTGLRVRLTIPRRSFGKAA